MTRHGATKGAKGVTGVTALRNKYGSFSTVSAGGGGAITVDFLVVASGGGGAMSGAGAGGVRSSYSVGGSQTGGGGTVEAAKSIVAGQAITIVIGAGQPGSTDTFYNRPAAPSATDTYFTYDSVQTACMGGGAGAPSANGPPIGHEGGSGGGCSNNVNNGAAGTANQGYRGGNLGSGATSPLNHFSTGGGGAGGTGIDVDTQSPQSNGGPGIYNLIATTASGVSGYYAGGGGGGMYTSPGQRSYGGSGGGGNSATSHGAQNAQAGATNCGGGGGGQWLHAPGYSGANGGSGIIVFRWLTSAGSITVGAGLTADATGTDGSYSYKRFTAGSGTVTFA